MVVYAECAYLLQNFMDEFLPTLWKNKREEVENIIIWREDEDTVTALDRFASWEVRMSDSFPETMQDLYNKLNFHRDRQETVPSPSGPHDWTFAVYVIRFTFMFLLHISSRRSFEDRPLSIQLLDDMEEEMIKADGRRTPPPHAERRGRDTPEPKGARNLHLMLLRLRDFI
jgi:hypothetical protein